MPGRLYTRRLRHLPKMAALDWGPRSACAAMPSWHQRGGLQPTHCECCVATSACNFALKGATLPGTACRPTAAPQCRTGRCMLQGMDHSVTPEQARRALPDLYYHRPAVIRCAARLVLQTVHADGAGEELLRFGRNEAEHAECGGTMPARMQARDGSVTPTAPIPCCTGHALERAKQDGTVAHRSATQEAQSETTAHAEPDSARGVLGSCMGCARTLNEDGRQVPASRWARRSPWTASRCRRR